MADDFNAGVIACVDCHYGSDQGKAKGFVKDYKSNQFVRLDESFTWESKDPHSLGFTVLSGELGQQMGRLLGNIDVTKAPQCLTCHAVDLTKSAPLAEKQFYTKAGVSCNGCHGLKETWQARHFKEAPDGSSIPWRSFIPAEKQAAGMQDLRDPVVKAKLCVSCHVGSPELGRVVTHEMYAAGHPPLPPFELAAYMEGQPRHWGYPTELPYFEKVPAGETWPMFHFHPAKDESYLGRHYAVGAVAALRAEAELLLANVEDKNSDGIDFARFDCYACHHDLKSPSDRQKRGYAGPPGRPPLRASIGVPAGVVARHAAGIDAGGLKSAAAGFDEAWGGLRAAALARPFGDPAKVRDSAKAVIAWADGFLKIQSECPTPLYSEAQAKQLREMIAAAAKGNAGDPEAAMCLAWGYLALSNEAKRSFPKDTIAALEGVMPLNVRVGPFTEKGGPVSAQFAPRMRAINKFEAGKFADAFGGLVGK